MRKRTLTKIIGTNLLAGAVSLGVLLGSVSHAVAQEDTIEITRKNIQEIVEQRLEEQPLPEESFDIKLRMHSKSRVYPINTMGRGKRVIDGYLIDRECYYGYHVGKIYIVGRRERGYKDRLFEVKFYPQAMPEIQSFIGHWVMLK